MGLSTMLRFKTFGGRDPHRPAEDVAFSVARFFQKGGSLNNYYMVQMFLFLFLNHGFASYTSYCIRTYHSKTTFIQMVCHILVFIFLMLTTLYDPYVC